jgi:hypothetical protein
MTTPNKTTTIDEFQEGIITSMKGALQTIKILEDLIQDKDIRIMNLQVKLRKMTRLYGKAMGVSFGDEDEVDEEGRVGVVEEQRHIGAEYLSKGGVGDSLDT